MIYLRKFLNTFFDLIYRPNPSCKAKPLNKTELIYFVLMIIVVVTLLWLGKQAV